jgi:hypothetical protein
LLLKSKRLRVVANLDKGEGIAVISGKPVEVVFGKLNDQVMQYKRRPRVEG